MQYDFRMYGYLYPINEQQAVFLKDILNEMEIDIENLEFHFCYEGCFIDDEDILDKIFKIIPLTTKAIIDCIDMQDWKMIRHYMQNGKWTKENIHINEVMDKKNYEQAG